MPYPRAILTQRPGNGAGFRGDRRSGSYGGVPLNKNLRRHTPVPVSDSILWLPNFQRADRVNLEHSQADYEYSSKRDIHDEYLIPEALRARTDSARNSRLGHQWHTNTFHTISRLTCEFPNTTPTSVTQAGLFLPILRHEVHFHQVIHLCFVRPEGDEMSYVSPHHSKLVVLAVDLFPTREQLRVCRGRWHRISATLWRYCLPPHWYTAAGQVNRNVGFCTTWRRLNS